MPKTIIVGGGLAGLATAVKLLDAGIEVELIEKRDVLGGKTSSWQDDAGDHIESGLHCYFRCYKELLPFFKHVGVYQHIRWKEHSFLIARPEGRHARLHFPKLPAPLNGVVAFTNNDLFTLREKLSNLLGLATTWIGTLDYIKTLDSMSFRQWRQQHLIAEGVERKLWDAICLSLGFIGAEDMSARPMATIFHYFATVADASQFGTLDGSPNERIFKPIAEWIRARGGCLRTGVKVEEVVLERGGVAGLRLSDGSTARGDAYVLAAPVHSTRQLLPNSLRSIDYFDKLWKLRSVPTINVQLWFDRYVTRIDNFWFTADACFSVFGDLALTSPQQYDRHGGSMVEMCVAPAAPYWQLSDAEIVELCRRDLARLWPEVCAAKLIKGTATRIPNSLYREEPGADRYRPDQRSPIANLFLAGDWTAQDYMASMEGAVQSARRAAEYVMEYLGDGRSGMGVGDSHPRWQ
jgi:9,9'-di-cis-zeta-carotene desaturase